MLLRLIVALSFLFTVTSCGSRNDSALATSLIGSPHSIEYFDCEGRLTAGDSDRSAALARGENSSLSLFVQITSDLKRGSHGVGFYEISDSTRMSYEFYKTGLIDDTEIQFGNQSSKADQKNVIGKLLKGTGYLEVAWDYKDGKDSNFLWRGRCKHVKDPPLLNVKQQEKPEPQ